MYYIYMQQNGPFDRFPFYNMINDLSRPTLSQAHLMKHNNYASDHRKVPPIYA